MADTHPEFGFKFNIGDDVIFSVARRASDRWNASRSDTGRKNSFYDMQTSAHPFNVVARVVEECYGGVQRHYFLRAASIQDRLTPITTIEGVKATADGLFRASEIELEAIAVADVVSEVSKAAE